jgi:hypothetical protein
LIIDFQNSQIGKALEAGIQVFIAVASKNIVDLKLAEGALVVREVLETLL